MDPINPIAGNPESLNQDPNPKQATDNHWITIVSMAIFVLLSLAAVAFLYYQNQQLKRMLASLQTPLPTSSPMTTADPTANWKTYSNESAGISFKYPPEIALKVTEKDLFWVNSSGDFQTNISWNSLPLTGTLEQELTSRDQCPTSVTNGIIPGPIPNSLRCDYDKSHYTSIKIWIANGKKVYKAEISSINPNVPVPQDDINLLNRILSTFKFTSPTTSPSAKPVACTLEAKICPDGSSVGRTGPNCEFAACPTP